MASALDDSFEDEPFEMELDDDDNEDEEEEEVDDDDDDGEAKQIVNNINPYEILSIDETIDEMKANVTEINSVFQIPATITRILLSHLKWDKQDLLEKLSDNNEEFFKSARVLNPFQNIKKVKRSPRTQIMCAICCDKYNATFVLDLGCNHSFCKECWSQYLKMKILDEGASELICCPAPDCDIIVDDVNVMKLLKDEEAKTKYQRLMTHSFVEHNRSLRWCPSPGCTYAVKANQLLVYQTTCVCKCGYEFCFHCGENDHDPVPCDLLKKWISNGHEETISYLSKYTKPCPKCTALIEKNGGCNHMSCKKCTHEFCWMCFQPWKNHSSCNVFKDVKTDSDDFQFDRFQHYFKRYEAHKRSGLTEQQHAAFVAKKKIKDLMDSSIFGWSELKFIENSVDILLKCRKKLMYSYIFAYYLKRCNQKEIFELNQYDLEQSVERLSGYLEQDVDESGNVGEIRMNILSKSKYCEQRCQMMEDYIYDGYNKDWWKFGEAT